MICLGISESRSLAVSMRFALTFAAVLAVAQTTASFGASDVTDEKSVTFQIVDADGKLEPSSIAVKTVYGNGPEALLTFPVGFDHGGPPSNNPFTGWTESGVNSNIGNAVLGNTDDVDRTDNTNVPYETGQGEPSTTATDLGTIVRASSGRYRILGWMHPNGIPYPGAGSYVRGKFYIYTNNAETDAVNRYPNFRARIQHGGAYVGVTNFRYTQTGETGGAGGDFLYSVNDFPPGETQAGQYLKPSRTASKPSLYRVDLDPIDVPTAPSRNILPVFETFAWNDQASATIYLAQFTMGTFPALTDGGGTEVMNYNATVGSGGHDVAFGALNVENDLTFGYKQKLFFSGQLATGTNQSGPGSKGLQIDSGVTNPSYTDRFVIGVVDILPTAKASRPRIAPGKYYRARFYATSDLPTTAAATGTQRQANVRFRLQTASASINCYQEFIGAITTANNTAAGTPGTALNNLYRDSVIAGQALPGINSVNPDKDDALEPSDSNYNGGWYTVLMPTPLDGDIRRDVDPAGVVNSTTFGTLFSQPGYGSPSYSLKDITAGVDVYTCPNSLKLGGTTLNGYYDANRAKVSLTAVKIFEYDASTVVDDGGYNY